MALEEAQSRLDDAFVESGFADFRIAGSIAAGEFRCSDCGYGAIVHRELPVCPMCGGSVWERAEHGRPFCQ